jgi:hypothetical protein
MCLFSFNLCGIRSRTCDPRVTSPTGWIILGYKIFYVLTFLANFQLIVAMNPFPCGCPLAVITKSQKQISGPLLDRIDICIEVPRVDYEKLSNDHLARVTYNPTPGMYLTSQIRLQL